MKDELEAEGTPYKSDVEEGIMIETPASVIISDDLAKEVDFFSIGTNDLTQYTLAIDRQNEKLDKFYNPHHKAILRYDPDSSRQRPQRRKMGRYLRRTGGRYRTYGNLL